MTSDSGFTWTQICKLVASDGAANDGFGTSVAMYDSTVLIGTNNNKTPGSMRIIIRPTNVFIL